MADLIKFLRGLKASLPTLAESVIGFCTDTDEVYIGRASGVNLNLTDTKHASGRQGFINGDNEVAQGTDATLSTSYQYGKVDMFAVKASGTAVSAGTITQSTSANTVSGNALAVTGVTLTGTGILYARYRMEAKDAKKFRNKATSFSVAVQHDVGSAINYSVTVRKPSTTADTFSSTTDIVTSSSTSVTSGSITTVKFENINNGNIGDCSYGLEFEVKVECGAVTSKNFYFGEWQFNKGAFAMSFIAKSFPYELKKCMRFFEKSYPYSQAPGTTILNSKGIFAMNIGTATTNRLTATPAYKVRKRSESPTCTLYDIAGNSGKISELDVADNQYPNITPTYYTASDTHIYISHNPTSRSGITFAWTIDCRQ